MVLVFFAIGLYLISFLLDHSCMHFLNYGVDSKGRALEHGYRMVVVNQIVILHALVTDSIAVMHF